MSEEITPFTPICMRSVVWFYQQLGKSCAETHADMVRVYGDETPDVATIYRWRSKYDGECPVLEDDQRSGRPRDMSLVPRVSAILEEIPSASARYITSQLLCAKETVLNILKKDLGLRFFNLQWVPHVLTAAQKSNRVKMCGDLHHVLTNSGLPYILTSDECWVTHYNPHVAKWARTRQEAGQRAKPTKEKTMIVMFWSLTGFAFVTAVPAGATYNTEYVTKTLIPELEAAICVRRPRIGLRGTKLHWDNARPHISTETTSLLVAKGVHLLPHPPYSPDVAPSDFYLFGKIKTAIRGTLFHSSDEIIEKFDEIFGSTPKEELQRVYINWLTRLKWITESGGEYYTI